MTCWSWNASGAPRVAQANSSGRRWLHGERKTVTALFADIKGSMELMEILLVSGSRTMLNYRPAA